MGLWTSLPTASDVADGDEFIVSQSGLYRRATRGQIRQQPGEDLDLVPAAVVSSDAPIVNFTCYDAGGTAYHAFLRFAFISGLPTLEIRNSAGGAGILVYGNGEVQIGGVTGFIQMHGKMVNPNGGTVITQALYPHVPVSKIIGFAAQTANMEEWVSDTAVTLSAIGPAGEFVPTSLTDAAAAVNSIYFSTTAGKLVYKDGAGTVNGLY